jgi:small-conductance mechanosensitive channel
MAMGWHDEGYNVYLSYLSCGSSGLGMIFRPFSFQGAKQWLNRLNHRLPLILCAVVLWLTATISPLYSQSNPTDDYTPLEKIEQTGAPVVLGDDTLFYIQARIGSFSPEFRAQIVSTRLSALAKQTEISLDALGLVDNDLTETLDIVVGEQTLVTIADVDAVAAGQTRQQLASEYLPIIRDSIAAYRSAYGLRNILLGVLYTFIATAIIVIIFLATNKSIPLLYRQLRRWRGTRIRAWVVLGTEILSAKRVVDLISEVIRMVRFALFLTILYVYVNLVLSFFPWTKGLARVLFGYILGAIDTLIQGFLDYVPNLFFLALIFFFTSYTLKIFRFLFTEIENNHISFPGFYAEWAKPTYKLVQFLILAFAATIAFPYLPGSETPAFQGISIFLGVLVSLGSSAAVANVVSGVILTYTRAFLEGDRVKIDETIGDIVEKNLFVTRICTVKNVVITIPNASVLSSHIINYSAAVSDSKIPPLILHTTVTLGYDVPWRKVHHVLSQSALATSEILADPQPFILQTSLDDFYVSYELNAYTKSPGKMAKIYSELHQQIQDQCNTAGIEILSPHYRAVRDGNAITIPEDFLGSS